MIIFLLILYVLVSVSLYKVFEKAGQPGWKALVPGLNFVVWAELVGRKKWHAAWLLFPIVNIFIFAALCIDLVRSFGQHTFWQSVVAVLLAPVAFFLIGFRDESTYEGPIMAAERDYKAKIVKAQKAGNKTQLKKLVRNNPFHKSGLREWTESIIFAVFAAAFIRMFLIEMYKIPTSSMEGSLLVGDFLCVSKAHYGVRMPMTIAMIPLLHNRIPFLDTESYFRKPSIDYSRLTPIESIDHNDPVVFNYPEGDSVIITPGRTYSVYDVRRGNVPSTVSMQDEIVVRPMDKMDHYIKRCIGLPGDSLQIIDRQVHLNGEPAQNPTHMQFAYIVRSQGGPLNLRKLQEWGVNLSDARDPIFMLDEQQVEKIKGMGNVTVNPLPQQPRPLFPYDQSIIADWTVDNYGPIYIPKKGVTVPISTSTLAPYKRIISKYEKNDLQVREGKVFINGSEANQYTFKMDYYWMMGDNRHNSEDSRVWGFVPEDHVVGKPLFIWFSTKDGSMANGIRWNRLFTGARKP
ncbi:MAG: signal peptidase I [Saprospiraceae bacterium]|nr:signal peptidase I [Saprospiraceae bacterium]